MTDSHESEARLQRLNGFLDVDPDNLSLIGDAALAAFDCGEVALTEALLARYGALALLSPALSNLQGLAALATGRGAEAVAIFRTLATADPDANPVRANLAWALMSVRDYEAVLEVADETLIAAQPQAGVIAVQALHHLGRIDDAMALGQRLVERGDQSPALMSALALVAMDAEQPETARGYAERAGTASHEGLATLGMLDLAAENADAAQARFNQALTVYPDSARALLGQGLTRLLASDAAGGAQSLERAATVFEDHPGSWVAAAWARLVNGDRTVSRAHFERAAAIDPAFAEPIGGLAVLDILEGDIEAARRRTETSLRLDRQGFAAALANSMLLAGDGNTAAAERVRTLALNTPVGADGKTILQALVGFGLAR